MSFDDSHPALIRLRAFWKAMHDWELALMQFFNRVEREGASDESIDAHKAQLRSALSDIFLEYCAAGEKSSRVNDVFHCGGNGMPEYNEQFERIESLDTASDRKVFVETQQLRNTQFRLRYEMVLKSGKWMLKDNRKCTAEWKTSWSRWPL